MTSLEETRAVYRFWGASGFSFDNHLEVALEQQRKKSDNPDGGPQPQSSESTLGNELALLRQENISTVEQYFPPKSTGGG